MPPTCQQVQEKLGTTLIKHARDSAIYRGQGLIEGLYNHFDSDRKIFEAIVSAFSVSQFIDLHQLVVRIVDRALFNCLHLFQSTDEIRLLISLEGADKLVDIKHCFPDMPQCVFGASAQGWIAEYSSYVYPYGRAEDAMSLWNYRKAPVAPLQLPSLPTFPDPSVEWDGRTAQQQEAMDKFGFWLIRVVRDKTMDEWLSVMAGREPPDVWLAMQARSLLEGWAERLQQARRLEEDVMITVLLEAIDCMLHDALYDIDARSEFTIAVETSRGWVADLTRVPMLVNLAAELFGEDGWIARFSRYPRAWVDRE